MYGEGMSRLPRRSHYSYTLFADPAVVEQFDQTRFGGEIGHLVALAQERVLDDFAGDLHGASVLDVGTGTGRAALAMAKIGGKVTGIDTSQEMLKVARSHAEAEGLEVEFVRGDAHALDFPDEAFDLVVSLRMLMHTPNWRQCLGEMCRVARHRVIFDYPPLFSAPTVQMVLRRLARIAGRRVETYHVISTLAARSVLHANGFQIERLHRQFVLPIALHKKVGSRRFTELSESTLARLGLLHVFGAPATIMAQRCAGTHPR